MKKKILNRIGHLLIVLGIIGVLISAKVQIDLSMELCGEIWLWKYIFIGHWSLFTFIGSVLMCGTGIILNFVAGD